MLGSPCCGRATTWRHCSLFEAGEDGDIAVLLQGGVSSVFYVEWEIFGIYVRPIYPLRVASFCLHVLRGLLTCTLVFPHCTEQRRLDHVQRWSARLLEICGVELIPSDVPVAPMGVMIVANHISWLDIFVLNACQPCYFIAKSEVRRWPVLGWLAVRAGTLFIERQNARALTPLMDVVTARLRLGSQVAYFPEGTSAAQGAMLPFHPALFGAARRAAVPIRPVALGYFSEQGKVHRGAEYIGDSTFVSSVLRILHGPPFVARVMFLPLINPLGLERRAVAHASHRAIHVALSDDSSA